MNKLTSTLMVAAIATAIMVSTGRAALDVGDLAPPLSISEWVKGEPVNLKKDASKRIHMVEFWAVWCPPCKRSVPLLTEIQRRYPKDLRIIGVTTPDNRGNNPSSIKRFVRQQGANMDYAVAVDDGMATYNAYIAAAGVMGIPHAFLVGKDGRIAWQGSPLDPAIGDVVSRLVGGTFDAETAKREAKANSVLQMVPFLVQRGQWVALDQRMKEALEFDPANEMALLWLVRVYVDHLRQQDAFRDWARAYIDKHKGDARVMRRVAVALCANNDLSLRTPDLALDAAKHCNDLTKGRQTPALVIYAQAVFQIGKLDRAIELQQKALEFARPVEVDVVKSVLEYYEKCKRLQAELN